MVHICDACLNRCRTSDGSYQCQKCPATFDLPNNLKMHYHIHLPRAIPCPRCAKEFRTSANVLQHIETGTCPSTKGKAFARKMIYVGAKRYGLHYVNGAIQFRGVPDYPYECPECHRYFRHGSQALQHLEDKHSQRTIFRSHSSDSEDENSDDSEEESDM